jgi:hypothetical protein
MDTVYGDFMDEEEVYFYLTEARKKGIIHSHVAVPVVILEPLKGRIITKPSDGDYLNLGDLQKFLWDKLSKHREFELMGRPVSELDIVRITKDWSMGKGFVSGDFSGATDNLAGEISALILNHITSRCGSLFRKDVLESFCKAKLDYRTEPLMDSDSPWVEYYQKWDCVEQGIVTQKNGQLMGHVLSFPILCLANYITFKYSFWKDGEDAPSVLINGDDILFCTDKPAYERWMATVNSVGLIPSLGKNLFQADIAQINSVLFAIRYGEVSPVVLTDDGLAYTRAEQVNKTFVRSVESVPYVNMGVLTGRGKGKENPFDRSSLSECERDLDQFEPEVTNLHSNFRLFDYTDLVYDRETLKSIYYRHRPIMSRMLKELESWEEGVVRCLFKKKNDTATFPGNSTAAFRQIGGDVVFEPYAVIREFQKYPYMFGGSLKIVKESRML